MTVIRKTVILRDLELLLPIGVYDHEKEAPQRVLISVEATMDGAEDEHDRLDATLDYDRLRNFVKEFEKARHNELQETLARRIVNFVLSNPGVIRVVVETSKPDVFDDCAFVGVRMEAER